MTGRLDFTRPPSSTQINFYTPSRARLHNIRRSIEHNHLFAMLSRHAPSPKVVSSLSVRVLPSSACATSRIATFSPSQQTRGLATVQDAPPAPKRVYGGLKDQDRIFQNLYGHHGADLASAKKYGDWHRTKDILAKGHDWVCWGNWKCHWHCLERG